MPLPPSYVVTVGSAIVHTTGQAWPPFVLVTGLLLIGAVVEANGLFEAVGVRLELVAGGPISSLRLALDAVVTAVLNLDTAVVFVTPIIIHVARQRGCDERPSSTAPCSWQIGASLLLPGST